jgi:hypothetical protein
MSTLDDAPEFASGITSTVSSSTQPIEPEPQYGEAVATLLAAASKSRLQRTQRLGTKALDALDALAKALKVEARLAELSDEIARVRKGEE